MFQEPQSAVVVREPLAVFTCDVAAVHQRAKRRQRAREPELLVILTVHQLQQLHAELDVSQPTRPELQLHVELVRVDVLGDPLAHALHRANEVFAAPRSPHHFSGLCNELCAEPQVARSCTRFEQGLKLPRLCPALVVGKHGAEGSHERPLAPLWS